jgi:hypothetical protein
VHNIGPRGFHVAPGRFTVTMIAGRDTSRQQFEVRADATSDVTVAEHNARESFLLEVVDVQSRLAARTTEFRSKLQNATGEDAQRLQTVAEELGLGSGAARGGRGGRGPGGGLSQIISGYTGSGVRQASVKAPTGTHKAALADAKRALAQLENALKP